MNLQNIIKIISALIGLVSAILLFRIIGLGDETIKMDASMGDFSSVSPLVNLALLVVGITVVVTLIFSLIGLASDGRKLKKAMISTGLFLAVVFISYALSTGVETPMKDGEVLSANGSRWVEAGLLSFYALALVAIGAMVFSGVKRIINR
jgi:hypothetical protein